MTTDSHQQLITLLNHQKEQLNLLLSLLRQEIASLAQRDIDTLEDISARKLVILETVQQLDQQIAAEPQLEILKKQNWFHLLIEETAQVLEECKHQNTVNQQTLEQSQLTLERFKTELLSARGKAGLTYTSKGKPAVDSKGKGIKA